MQKVRYNIVIQTYMEVYDYLITNNIFVYDCGEDFLQARIKIGEHGFIEEKQIRRGIWDEQHPQEKIVPAIRVLKILTDNIDDLLQKANIPTSPDSRYAYLHDLKSNEQVHGKSQKQLHHHQDTNCHIKRNLSGLNYKHPHLRLYLHDPCKKQFSNFDIAVCLLLIFSQVSYKSQNYPLFEI